MNTELNTPTPRTDDAQWGTGKVITDFARTLERELHESRNAERLARVQLGNERARLDDLLSVNATGAARLAHASAQLAAEREKVRVLRNAMKYLLNDDNYIDPQFDPCALASKAFEVTRDAK